MLVRAFFFAGAKTGPELKHGEHDCQRIHDVLTDSRYLGHDRIAQAKIHANCESSSEFVQKFMDFVKTSTTAEQRIVYFTGHGKVSKGEYGFSFPDDEFLPFAALIPLLRNGSQAKTMFILDTCYSGAAELGGLKNGEIFPSTGSCILASSRDIEFSQEDPILGSLFTKYLCDCIISGCDGVPTTEGLITVPDAANYVRKKLAEDEQNHGKGMQTPRYTIAQEEGHLWLAKNISGSSSKPLLAPLPLGGSDKHRLPCAGATISDLDQVLLQSYAQKYLRDDNVSLSDVIRELDLFYSNGEVCPTEAAVLCFGSRPERFFPNSASIFSAGDITSSSFERVPVEGPLARQLSTLVKLTISHLTQAAVFDDSVMRSDQSEIPVDVIREVIMNAIAHRSFDDDGRVQVYVGTSYIEVSNPGKVPDGYSWDFLLDHPGPSLSPNRRIANHLQRLGGYEGLGRGFAILHKYREERGKDAVVLTQKPGLVTCRLARAPRSAALLPPSSSVQMHSKLQKYLVQRGKVLAQMRSFSGETLAQMFVPRALTEVGGGVWKPERFKTLLCTPGKRLLLMGGIASGKSWYLARIAIDMITTGSLSKDNGGAGNRDIPFYIPLRNMRSDMPAIPAISDAAGIEADVLEYVFLKHRPVLLFDGADEIAFPDNAIILNTIKTLHESYPGITTLLSIRGSIGDAFSIGNDHCFIINDLSAEDVEIFLKRQGMEKEKRVRLLKLIESDTGALFRSPLLLTLLARSFNETGILHDAMDTVLDQIVQTLLFRHDRMKAGFIRMSVLEPREMQALVNVLALTMMVQNTASLSMESLTELIGRTLPLVMPDVNKADFGSIAKELQVSGLIAETSPLQFGFVHAALQEHLAIAGASRLSSSDVTLVAKLVVSLLRAGNGRGFVSKVVSAWAQSKSQADALSEKLGTSAKVETGDMAAGIRDLIAELAIHSEKLAERDTDFLRLLTGRD
jgi:hypothetical protein